MPILEVQTAQHTYAGVVERGILARVGEYIPGGTSKIFAVTTTDVWDLHGNAFSGSLQHNDLHVLFFPGGEANKRFARVEELADQMVEHGADRSSLVIGFGGGIVTDISGFLAAIFMRGIPVLQVPTTLLAQVDAAVGGKTGVNLAQGKNLIGSFHQPLVVLIDPDVLRTLPEREYRAGLMEVVKCGIIRDRKLFDRMALQSTGILAMNPDLVDGLISDAVRIKAEVVSEDEREGDLRRILNFGHTIGHAIEAETAYVRFLHGEAVALGMLAATKIAELVGMLAAPEASKLAETIQKYGPIPAPEDLDPDRLMARLGSDKKTKQGKVHFVLPTSIGAVKVVSGIDPVIIREAIVETLRTQ
jgi:3-dehydroquinate synthase